MRQLELLITQVRRSTENIEFSDNAGIGDDEIVQYFNDAQDELQAEISVLSPAVFQAEKVLSSVADQEAYAIPDDAFLGNRLDMVEYSRGPSANRYAVVKQGHLHERLSGSVSGVPSYYIRRSGEILLQPKPNVSSDSIRVTYQKKLPRLDIRSGTVSAVTLDSGTKTITALTLDITAVLDKEALEEEGFITIVTSNGSQQMRRIPIDSIDDATGIVSVTAGFTYETGETIAIGNFAIRGEESTTHSQLPANCERFLVDYTRMRVLQRDSSNDAVEAAALVAREKQSIIRSFSEPDRDVDYIPILDDQYMVSVDDY